MLLLRLHPDLRNDRSDGVVENCHFVDRLFVVGGSERILLHLIAVCGHVCVCVCSRARARARARVRARVRVRVRVRVRMRMSARVCDCVIV